ncbi:Rv1733c family protein [Streptomyces bobili]|uniref:Rv1733c family protein n=1 Tax=Streptomyces bobili TaxID=67280 RepID=UPI003F53F5B0
MSAQGPPYTSGPPPARNGHTPRGANPLRRTSDRFESWFRRLLMLILVLGLPVAAFGAGLTAYESSMDTVHAQAAERQEITARLTADAKDDNEVGKQPAQVRWTDSSGTVRTGAAFVEPGTHKGAAVRVWVDRDGALTTAPKSALNARTTGWFVGGMAAFGVAFGLFAARAGMRVALDRRRYAQWDAEWDLVEPQWSTRFRR